MILLLDAALKVSVILLLGLAATRLLRRSSAAMRHLILAGSLACAAAAPLLTQAVPSWTIELGIGLPLPPPARAGIQTNSAPAALEPTNVQQAFVVPAADAAGAAFTVSRLAVLIWVAGVAMTFSMLLIGLGWLAWMTAHSVPVTDRRWLEAIEAGAARQGLRPPQLLHSTHPTLIATWGARRPKVILPSTATEWPDDRIRVVLDHELAHIRRLDWLVHRGADLMRCLFWLTPVSWLVCRRLRQESEQACDDVVLKSGVTASTYAFHLLALAHAARRANRMWLPAATMARPSSLERRIRVMLRSDVNRDPVTPVTRWATAGLLLALSLPVITFDALGQTRFATVSGVVTDETGAVLVGTAVSLANAETGTKYEVRSNQSGAFEFMGVAAGSYDFSAQRLGFEKLVEPLAIGVGETLQKNVSLRVGSVQETITVVGSSEGSAPERRVVTAKPAAPRPCPNPAVGGCIGFPVKTKDVRPLYPPTLASAGLAGKVTIEGVIGTDGRMKDMRVVSSPHPDLERAALDAVGEWEFTATTLNGRAIETRINVDVGFATSQTR